MFAALSQPDAERFSIYIDAVIDAPRFNLSGFCKTTHRTYANETEQHAALTVHARKVSREWLEGHHINSSLTE